MFWPFFPCSSLYKYAKAEGVNWQICCTLPTTETLNAEQIKPAYRMLLTLAANTEASERMTNLQSSESRNECALMPSAQLTEAE